MNLRNDKQPKAIHLYYFHKLLHYSSTPPIVVIVVLKAGSRLRVQHKMTRNNEIGWELTII